ncbi:MAG: DUF2127 domain-containing protein [Actinomycetota bacterium]
MVSDTTISTHRAAALVFAVGAALCAVLFGRGITQDRILSGTFTYGLACAVVGWGLWRGVSWARPVALIIVVGNVGLGALQLVAVIVSDRGNLVAPIIVVCVSVLLGYLLGRPSSEHTREPT